MATAVGVAAGLLALLVLLLAVPVDLAFDVAFDIDEPGAVRGKLVVGWLFGLVRVRADCARGCARPAAGGMVPTAGSNDGARGPSSSARSARRGSRTGRALVLLRRAEFRERTWRLLKDLGRAARLEGLRLRLRLGLGDPADTGRLWAVIGPLGAAARQLRDADVVIEPEFFDGALDVEARGRMRCVPLQLLAVVLGFALSPPALRAWRALGGGRA
jgi:hypothetical protein